MAGRIFAFFEHHLNPWRIAHEADDASRLDLLDVELDFWFESYLRNPRLLWFFAEDGGGLIHQMDPPNRDIYRRRTLDDPELPLLQLPDAVGILVPGGPVR